MKQRNHLWINLIGFSFLVPRSQNSLRSLTSYDLRHKAASNNLIFVTFWLLFYNRGKRQYIKRNLVGIWNMGSTNPALILRRYKSFMTIRDSSLIWKTDDYILTLNELNSVVIPLLAYLTLDKLSIAIHDFKNKPFELNRLVSSRDIAIVIILIEPTSKIFIKHATYYN